ncbi:hypothetical protein BJ170DRAFT_629054 [Xylariales sp. AK1849]|nr:hypothetical protein BJ170DRAFT_629054 [Xylariales sp. AK1849]
MCDVESYCYLPLLEETGYVPKHRYSYGPEIRSYFNLIAEKWGFKDNAFFQTHVQTMEWDDTAKEWTIDLLQKAKGQEEQKFSIRSQFAIVASGPLNHPKIPKIPGIDEFKGHMFHTSRWNYDVTGGSPEDPILAGLKDKSVGIIGTGATAVQVLPHLGKCAKQVYVFQRTPTAVDYRDQRETDTAAFKEEIATKQGWQKDRNINFCRQHMAPAPGPGKNLVDDAWSNFSSFSGLMGTPTAVTMETLPRFLEQLHATDLPRQERIRARIDSIVKDKDVAEKLKPWYPGWCKRPGFHDDYLETFNRPNVKLVDTDGKGLSALTPTGIKLPGNEYDVDVLILSTGFRAVFIGSPAHKAGISITGRSGRKFEDKFNEGLTTLHGVTTREFPNLFFQGFAQSGVAANTGFTGDCIATHVAGIIGTALRKAGAEARFAIEATPEAEEAWTGEIVKRALVMAALTGCTPSYFNLEGMEMPPEEQLKQIKAAPWGAGLPEYLKVVEAWREKGDLEGLVITPA